MAAYSGPDRRVAVPLTVAPSEDDPIAQALMARGLRAYGGNSRPWPIGDPATAATPAVAAAVAERNGAQSSGTDGSDIAVNPAVVEQATRGKPPPVTTDPDADVAVADDFDPLIPLGVGGGIVGSSMLYRLLKGRKGPQGVNDPEFGAPKGGEMTTDADGFQYRQPRPRRLGTDIPYGEFTEVNEPRVAGQRLVTGGQPKLTGPQSRAVVPVRNTGTAVGNAIVERSVPKTAAATSEAKALAKALARFLRR